MEKDEEKQIEQCVPRGTHVTCPLHVKLTYKIWIYTIVLYAFLGSKSTPQFFLKKYCGVIRLPLW